MIILFKFISIFSLILFELSLLSCSLLINNQLNQTQIQLEMTTSLVKDVGLDIFHLTDETTKLYFVKDNPSIEINKEILNAYSSKEKIELNFENYDYIRFEGFEKGRLVIYFSCKPFIKGNYKINEFKGIVEIYLPSDFKLSYKSYKSRYPETICFTKNPGSCTKLGVYGIVINITQYSIVKK